MIWLVVVLVGLTVVSFIALAITIVYDKGWSNGFNEAQDIWREE